MSIDTTDSVTAITDVVESYGAALTVFVLRAACRVGVFDELGDEPMRVADLASRIGAEPVTLRRVLRFLAADGWVDACDDHAFRLTARGAVLRADASPSMASMLTAVGSLDAVGGIGDALRTGEAAFAAVNRLDFWSFLDAHPDASAEFDRKMVDQGRVLVTAWVDALAWPRVGTVVDVGGGTGDLAAALLRMHPGVRVALVERPGVLDAARRRMQAERLVQRCDFVAADFRECVPAGDVYVLARVLHDWDDDTARQILRTAARAAPPHATLRIIESVVPESGPPLRAAVADLTMLLLFGGGQERTEAHLRALLAEAGWRWTLTRPGPMTSVVEAVPASSR